MAVPAAGFAMVKTSPTRRSPRCRPELVIVIPINNPVPTVHIRIHSHLRVDISAEQTVPQQGAGGNVAAVTTEGVDFVDGGNDDSVGVSFRRQRGCSRVKKRDEEGRRG